MNTTLMLVLNAALALTAVGALGTAVRVAFRLSDATHAETLHPSQPLPLRLVAREDAERDPARAA